MLHTMEIMDSAEVENVETLIFETQLNAMFNKDTNSLLALQVL